MGNKSSYEKAFNYIFNEERINIINDIINGEYSALFPTSKEKERKKLEELGFEFNDIPTDDMFWNVSFPIGWYAELKFFSPNCFSLAMIDDNDEVRGNAYYYVQGLNPIADIELFDLEKKHNI